MEIFIIFSFFAFFLPNNQISANTPTCSTSNCKKHEPDIQFPFRLGDRQATHCGYGQGFDLSCSRDKRTVLTLPSKSPGEFIVKEFDYSRQLLWIDDPQSCFPRRLLDGDFSLVDSPFSYLYGLENSTFLNCSSQAAIRSNPIPCLSRPLYYNVLVVPSGWYYGDPNTTSMNSSLSPASISPDCFVIATALVPRSSPSDPSNIIDGVPLAWDLPECRSCEESSCGYENATSSEVVCTSPAHSASGITKNVKLGIVLGFGIPGIVAIIGVLICAFKVNASNQARQLAITELSTVVSQQPPPAVRMGLDSEAIELYPKTQIGESFDELLDPNDKTCVICLCEYQHKEIIRTIPQCKHFFHASCIDEWFKKDMTCPLCRDQPDFEALRLHRPPLQDASALPTNGSSLGFPRPVLQNTTVQHHDHMYFMIFM